MFFPSLNQYLRGLLNDTLTLCTHTPYTLCVQQELDEHKASWNHHKLSTEGNKSPLQIRTLFMDTAKAPPDAVNEDVYGVEDLDEDADLGDIDDEGMSMVHLEPRVNPLSDASYVVFSHEAPPVARDLKRPAVRTAIIDALEVLGLLLLLDEENNHMV